MDHFYFHKWETKLDRMFMSFSLLTDTGALKTS